MQQYAATWDYLQAGFKFYVDEGAKLIVFAPDTETIDIKIDIYSALKRWFAIRTNASYPFAIRSIGGDPTTGVQRAGDTYFMINGYRIVYDVTKVQVTGILYSDDFDTPWLQKGSLAPVYPASVSNLALTTEVGSAGGGGVTAEDIQAIAQAVAALFAEPSMTTAGIASSVPDPATIATAVWNHTQ